MTTPKIFELNGINKVFQSDVPIKGKDYVAVYISQTGLSNSYTIVPQGLYEISNEAVVFTVAPTGTYLRLIVGTNRSELLNAPSNIAIIASNMDAINYVAGNIDAIVDAYTVIATAENIETIILIGNNMDNIILTGNNIGSINTVASSINSVNTVSTDISKVILVANSITKVNNVSDNLVNVDKVGTDITNVNHVGSNITKVNLVADNVSKVSVVYTDLNDINSKITRVANSITNVNTVGTSINNVNIVANNIGSIVNKAKFKVRSEVSMDLDVKTNTKFPVITALPDMVGFEVHTATNSVKNVSGRDLDIIGSVAIQVISTSTVDIPIYMYSETSIDGVTWTINQSSLRKVKIIKEGTDYISIPSLLITTKWLNGTYNRFRLYKEGSGGVSITPVTDTINGTTVIGHSFIWTIHEV